MAAKKMFPPGEVDRLLGNKYDEFKLGIGFRILAGQIVMQFSDHVEWVRMTSGGARKLAAMLSQKADELDRRGNASAAAGKRQRYLGVLAEGTGGKAADAFDGRSPVGAVAAHSGRVQAQGLFSREVDQLVCPRLQTCVCHDCF